MVDPKLIQKAKARIQSRSPNAFGIEPTNDEILNEVSSIEQENQEQNLAEEQDKNAQLESRMESSQKSRALFGDQISPELKDYAYDIFPSLNKIAPKSKTEIPFAPEEEPVAQESASPESLTRQPSSLEKPKAIPRTSPSSTPTQKQIEQVPQAQQSIQSQYDIEGLIKQSEEEEDRAALLKQSAKLRDAIMGAGLGKIKQTDVSMYEDMEKKAQRPLRNLVLKQELEDKKSKNDPNSPISKLMRKSIENLGMDMTGLENISASQIEKLYPSLAQGLYSKIAAETRKEEAIANRQMRAELAANKEEARNEAKYEKTRTIVNNKIAKLQESRNSPFKGYQDAKMNLNSLNNAIAAWDNEDENVKLKISEAFMRYAKQAQGDDSVVRSSDMQALAGGLNLRSPTELFNKFAAKAQGASFTKGELLEMKNIINAYRKFKKEELQQRLNPIRLDAKRGGYDLDQSISPDVIDEIYAEEPKPLEERAKRIKELRKKDIKQGK